MKGDSVMNRRKKIIMTISIVTALYLLIAFILPLLLEYRCKTRSFDEFEEKITDNIMKSNIVIVDYKEKKESGHVIRWSYGIGASGVIFKQDGDMYYALTAYHVVKDYLDAEYFIIPYGAPTYSEYRQQSDAYVLSEDYFGQFEKATVILADENYDLAVISFKSDETLNTLSIEDVNPVYNEKIAVISNPMGERFLITFGTIRSKGCYPFESDDGSVATKTLKHNAYINEGSSGSVVLNNNMDIVGINIGGTTNIYKKFVYGAMVPSEVILEFLAENNFVVE